MIDFLDRISREEKDNEDCNIKFLLDNLDLATLLSDGCLIGDVNGTKIKIELDM